MGFGHLQAGGRPRAGRDTDLLAELMGRQAELHPEEVAEVARVPDALPGGRGVGGQVCQVGVGEVAADAVQPPAADVVPDGARRRLRWLPPPPSLPRQLAVDTKRLHFLDPTTGDCIGHPLTAGFFGAPTRRTSLS
jgi:hypothetical protein